MELGDYTGLSIFATSSSSSLTPGTKRKAVSDAIGAVVSDARSYFVDRQKLAAEILERFRTAISECRGAANLPQTRIFWLPVELALIFLSLTLFFLARGDRVLVGGYLRLAVGKLFSIWNALRTVDSISNAVVLLILWVKKVCWVSINICCSLS